jgi:hypothetical protein
MCSRVKPRSGVSLGSAAPRRCNVAAWAIGHLLLQTAAGAQGSRQTEHLEAEAPRRAVAASLGVVSSRLGDLGVQGEGRVVAGGVGH